MKAALDIIRIVNFKSFRRAVIPLPAGLVAITGPNGSGKSNILDAIAFVMGWRASRLRASKMENLVRKGSNAAEVSLLIRNSAERISVSKEIRPSGEGVYRVNGKRRSATEVMELLREMGFLVDRYTFVTQGDITSIVEMSPRERARLLEEISGVAEYDERKEKALEELREVNQLLREMEVLIKEREREVRKVEREVRALEEKEEMEERLRRVEKYLLMVQMEEIQEKLETLERVHIEGDFSDVDSLREELEEREAELRKLEERVKGSPVRRRRRLQAEIEALSRQISALERALESQKDALSALSRTKEVPGVVKEDPSFLGVVSDLVTPLEGYEIPYLAVGGGRLGDIVVRDLEGAKRIAKVLRNVRGRFRIIPLDVIRVREPPELPGTLGPLHRFLVYDERFGAVAKLVFNAVLVEDLDSITREMIGRARFVTLGGEIVEREGSLLAGRPERDVQRINRIREEMRKLENELESLRKERRRKEDELRDLPEEDPDLERLEDLRREVSRLRRSYQEALSRRRAYLSRLEEISEEKGVLKEKMRVLESELRKLAKVEPLSVPDPAGEVASLRTRLKLLGPVNPKAREEYEARRKELEEVTNRYREFDGRRRGIEELIERLDREREEVVERTLERLSGAFDEQIRLLFGGGGGELRLTERGLEMRVRLPSKKPVSIDSLSGGEKSLSALAFILAAQRLRPSSLYVFDEADAMLDGVNCKRYVRALKELSKRAQVVVISLKKETLEEVDHLIGVTMRDGESKIVAVSREAAS